MCHSYTCGLRPVAIQPQRTKRQRIGRMREVIREMVSGICEPLQLPNGLVIDLLDEPELLLMVSDLLS